MQGASETVVKALKDGDLAAAQLPEAERCLLEFAQKVTRHAHQVENSDVETLRRVGWTDPQIAEAVYITSLFAFFNRVADAFGLEDPGYGSGRSGPSGLSRPSTSA